MTQVLIHFYSEMLKIGKCDYSKTMWSKDIFRFVVSASDLSGNTIKVHVLNRILGRKEKNLSVKSEKQQKSFITENIIYLSKNGKKSFDFKSLPLSALAILCFLCLKMIE